MDESIGPALQRVGSVFCSKNKTMMDPVLKGKHSCPARTTAVLSQMILVTAPMMVTSLQSSVSSYHVCPFLHMMSARMHLTQICWVHYNILQCLMVDMCAMCARLCACMRLVCKDGPMMHPLEMKCQPLVLLCVNLKTGASQGECST